LEYCPNCGAEVYPGEAVCEVCGARLRARRRERRARHVKASYRPAALEPAVEYRGAGYRPAAPVARPGLRSRLEGAERPASAALAAASLLFFFLLPWAEVGGEAVSWSVFLKPFGLVCVLGAAAALAGVAKPIFFRELVSSGGFAILLSSLLALAFIWLGIPESLLGGASFRAGVLADAAVGAMLLLLGLSTKRWRY